MLKRVSMVPQALSTASVIALMAALVGACAPEDGRSSRTAEAQEVGPAPVEGERGLPADTAVNTVEVVLTEFDVQLTHDQSESLSDTPPGAEYDSVPPMEADTARGETQVEKTDSLPAGRTEFRIRNAGSMQHNFEIAGGSIEERLPSDLPPGETATLTVEFDPGTYRIYCPIEDHAERGMSRNIVITAGPVYP